MHFKSVQALNYHGDIWLFLYKIKSWIIIFKSEKHKENLWIHCKDIVTLHEFSIKTNEYNFFFHDKDDYTLTSKHHIWAYPGKSYTDNTVIVMPEWEENVNWNILKSTNCYGICTDYPQRLI